MLKFWKKTGRKEITGNSGSNSSSASSTPRSHSSPTCNGGSFFTGNLAAQIKDLEELLKQDKIEITSSCLCKTLVEVINDNEAFTYFIQYLETVGCGAMIKFILDVESFNSALASSSSSGEAKGSSPKRSVETNSVHEKDKRLGRTPGPGTVDSSSHDNSSSSSEIGCEESSLDRGRNCEDVRNVGTNCRALEENEVLSRLLDSAKSSESSADAVKIFNKYFSHNAPLKIALTADVQRRLVENLNSTVNKESFSEVKDYILKKIEKEHFNDYLKSECHCKYQIDILTSKKVCMSDILYNETALFYFMEFLEQEGCTSFLEFWISALNFQQQYEEQGQNYDTKQAQSDAMVLYDKYFSLQATSPLNLGDDIRIKVEESICRERGPLPNCFEYPRKLVLKLLEMNYFQPFLQSQLYFKYLSELISTIQSPLMGPRSRHSGDSDGGSDISISATNTLLAAEDVNPTRLRNRHANSASLTIDTQQLYNPDLLWQRGPKRPGLNFGRINSLGRFETDLEPEPDKKEESRITKAVKKLVNLNEDKSKEEMAWQVAAMIVRDVTNITMPPSTDS